MSWPVPRDPFSFVGAGPRVRPPCHSRQGRACALVRFYASTWRPAARHSRYHQRDTRYRFYTTKNTKDTKRIPFGTQVTGHEPRLHQPQINADERRFRSGPRPETVNCSRKRRKKPKRTEISSRREAGTQRRKKVRRSEGATIPQPPRLCASARDCSWRYEQRDTRYCLGTAEDAKARRDRRNRPRGTGHGPAAAPNASTLLRSNARTPPRLHASTLLRFHASTHPRFYAPTLSRLHAPTHPRIHAFTLSRFRIYTRSFR
jgi:hypothetical protein